MTMCPHGVDLRFAKCMMCADPAFHAAQRPVVSVQTATIGGPTSLSSKQVAMQAGSWFDRADLTLEQRENEVAKLIEAYARRAHDRSEPRMSTPLVPDCARYPELCK